MAVVAFVDGVLTLNSVDLSDHVESATLEIEGTELDASSIADDWDVTVLGRKRFTLNITFFDDFASSKVDATVWAAFNAGTAIGFTLKPTSGTISSTNPEYQGNVIPSKSPVGGSGGDLLKKSVAFKGTGAITRDTTP